MNEIELYVNKKFDILKIIKMVLKRKGWGETYTLYSTPFHEVLATMESYNFKDQNATFELIVNEKAGLGYKKHYLTIYTNRDDYSVEFINKLLLKKIISLLESYRYSVFEKEAADLFPYIWRSNKKDAEWIEEFGLEKTVNKVKKLDIEEDQKEAVIDNLIDTEINRLEQNSCFGPRDKYIEQELESNREKAILDLIKEVKEELNVL